MKKNFDAGNLNFVARIAIFLLGVLAAFGIKFPQSPEAITDQITTTISTSGFYAVIGILVVSVIMPIYNFIRAKEKINFAQVFGSPNLWIYVASFGLGWLVLAGVSIPEATAEQLISAVFTKDWAALIGIVAANIIDPLVRYWKDKKNTP